jgi:hypothetical protein
MELVFAAILYKIIAPNIFNPASTSWNLRNLLKSVVLFWVKPEGAFFRFLVKRLVARVNSL